jgi:hypothetical protein
VAKAISYLHAFDATTIQVHPGDEAQEDAKFGRIELVHGDLKPVNYEFLAQWHELTSP